MLGVEVLCGAVGETVIFHHKSREDSKLDMHLARCQRGKGRRLAYVAELRAEMSVGDPFGGPWRTRSTHLFAEGTEPTSPAALDFDQQTEERDSISIDDEGQRVRPKMQKLPLRKAPATSSQRYLAIPADGLLSPRIAFLPSTRKPDRKPSANICRRPTDRSLSNIA